MSSFEDTDLLCDMYDNFVYGTLAQKTKMERQNPGSLSQSLKNSVESKACACVCDSFLTFIFFFFGLFLLVVFSSVEFALMLPTDSGFESRCSV